MTITSNSLHFFRSVLPQFLLIVSGSKDSSLEYDEEYEAEFFKMLMISHGLFLLLIYIQKHFIVDEISTLISTYLNQHCSYDDFNLCNRLFNAYLKAFHYQNRIIDDNPEIAYSKNSDLSNIKTITSKS